MFCAPGTHERAIQMLQKVLQPASPILDLGSGSGAFLLRLRDSGYTVLEGADICAEQGNIDGISIQTVNLNGAFGNGIDKRYSAIVAIETIEHLESPRNFIRQAWSLLSEDGYILISTPNIAHWLGRIQFLLTGRLRYFGDRLYHQQRHISIIPDNHVRLLLSEVGFAVVESCTAGTFMTSLSQALLSPISLISRLLLGRTAVGDVTLYLAKRCLPDVSTPGRNPDYARHYLPK